MVETDLSHVLVILLRQDARARISAMRSCGERCVAGRYVAEEEIVLTNGASQPVTGPGFVCPSGCCSKVNVCLLAGSARLLLCRRAIRSGRCGERGKLTVCLPRQMRERAEIGAVPRQIETADHPSGGRVTTTYPYPDGPASL